jgi:hypothetical protein
MYPVFNLAYLVGCALDVLVGLRCFVFGVAPVPAVKRVLQRPLDSLLLLLLACQGCQLASVQEAAGIPSRVVESRPRVEPTVSWPRCERTIHTSDWAHLNGSDRAVPVGVGFGGLVRRRHVVDCCAGVVAGDASAGTRHTATTYVYCEVGGTRPRAGWPAPRGRPLRHRCFRLRFVAISALSKLWSCPAWCLDGLRQLPSRDTQTICPVFQLSHPCYTGSRPWLHCLQSEQPSDDHLATIPTRFAPLFKQERCSVHRLMPPLARLSVSTHSRILRQGGRQACTEVDTTEQVVGEERGDVPPTPPLPA